jgi:hypothetical protein
MQSCLISFGQESLSPKPGCEEYIFSNVRHIAEVDDYIGTEIVLSICSETSEVRGSWHQYEGYNPAVTDLIGNLDGTMIQLRGKNTEGTVEFRGYMDDGRLIGKLVWYLGTNRQEKDVSLLKKKYPSSPTK